MLEIERDIASNTANIEDLVGKVATASAQVDKATHYLAVAQGELDALLLAQREREELGEELQQTTVQSHSGHCTCNF